MKLGESIKPIGLLVLAIPFLVMLAMIGVNHNNMTAYKEYRFPITGYDPRDLLRGHYMTFRYVWPDDATDMFKDNTYPRTEKVCACLSGETIEPAVRFDACVSTDKRQKACKAGIQVDGGHGQPSEDLRQYYIPEEHAPMLERMLRSGKYKFEVGIMPRPDHEAQLYMLYVDGVRLDDLLAGDLTPYLADQ